METVKTAISINKALFEQAEALAGEMNLSRSGLYALALEDYIRRRANRALLEQINSVYAAEPEVKAAPMGPPDREVKDR